MYKDMEPALYNEGSVARFESKTSELNTHRNSIKKQKRPPNENEIAAIGAYNLEMI